MKKSYFLLLAICFIFARSGAQNLGFKFGQFSYDDLKMTSYPLDSSAAAVVLAEYGEAHFDNELDPNVVFEYHVKIKVLKPEALGVGDYEIWLRKDPDGDDRLLVFEAKTFNLVNGSASESVFEKNKILTEEYSKQYRVKKMALPNVKVGSVIDLWYVTESPWLFQFHEWEFQSKYPKVKSEYTASIAMNYVYNITMRGYLPLTLNESSVKRSCWSPTSSSADCAHYRWGMQNIPAFVEEDYMTAPSNFKAAIRFELSEIHAFDGENKKYTEEWKDVDKRYRVSEKFGSQLKKADNVWGQTIDVLVAGESDPLAKAKKIYTKLVNHYTWNEAYGDWTDVGVVKAYENKKGNVADINLALVGALRYAGLDADPMILSTRAHGAVTEVHPVMSDFNYVVAKLNIGDKVYLLDATVRGYPFGVLPLKCLNGKGRVMDGDKESYWYEVKPADRSKEITILNIKLNEDGTLNGTINKTYMGYASALKRLEINSFNAQKDYINDFDKDWVRGKVNSFTIENVDDVTKPITEKLDVTLESIDDINAPTFFFNPFVVDKWTANPFKSKERLYPVDYGYAQDEVMILTLELPASIEAAELPAKLGLALPNGGGRFIYDVQVQGKNIVVNSSLSIAKPLFSPEEYHFIKELYDRILQLQNADLVLKKTSK